MRSGRGDYRGRGLRRARRRGRGAAGADAGRGLAASMPIIGPNGVGYINVPKKLDLTMLNRFSRRPGGASMIAQSGATIEAMAASAWRAGGVGFNMMISAGNEPVTDMADYLEYLVDDPATEVICPGSGEDPAPGGVLRRRRPGTAGGQAGHRGQARPHRPDVSGWRMSHTGTLTGDAWVYEQAFKQAAILRADEIDELVDRVQFLEQLPRSKWSPVRGLFVFTGTGGFAAMAGDMADSEGVDIPEAARLSELDRRASCPARRCPTRWTPPGSWAAGRSSSSSIMQTYLGRAGVRRQHLPEPVRRLGPEYASRARRPSPAAPEAAGARRVDHRTAGRQRRLVAGGPARRLWRRHRQRAPRAACAA